MVPNLTTEDRLRYAHGEQEFIEELLEDTDDCKWIYQALIDVSVLEAKLLGSSMTEERQASASEWLTKLKALDPLRKGRWDDLGRMLEQ